MTKLKTPFLLAIVTLVWGFEVYRYGGVLTADVVIGAGALSLTGLLWWLTHRSTLALPPVLWVPILLLPLYLVFQLLPLPIGMVHFLSPARAELALAMAPIFGTPASSSLTATPTATIDQLLRVLAYAIVFLLIRDATVDSRRKIWRIVIPLLTVGGLEAVFGLLRFASRTDAEVAQGTFVNRNHFAGMLAMLVPFAVMFAVDLFGRRHSPWAKAARVLAGVAAGIMMLAVVQSVSRMGFVAMAGSLTAMAILFGMLEISPRRRWLVAGITLLGAAALMFILPTQRVLIRLLQSGAEGSSLTRIEIWKSAIRQWQHYPIFGSGAGTFGSVVYRYEVSPMNYTPDFAHNDYLQGLGELGVVGFIVPATFLATILILAVQCARRADSRTVRLIALACFGGLIAILIHSLADFNLCIPSNAILVAWICGIVAGLPRPS